MKKLKRNINGITLIALVVTIIILLILAGVALTMALSENGLFKMASQAGDVSKDVAEEEKVKLTVSSAFLDGTGTLSTDNLKKAFENEFGEDKVTDTTFTGTGPWTFKGERKTYTIEASGKVVAKEDDTLTSVEGKLATDILKIDTNADENAKDYERSPYVKYGGLTCRVLYNDGYENGSHGLQLVSVESIKQVELGVENHDSYLAGRKSYNLALKTLDDAVQASRKSDGIATDVRCLGSKASLVEGKFQKSLTQMNGYTSLDPAFEDLQCSTFCSGDDDYLDDVGPEGHVITLGLAGEVSCWLASRYVEEIGSELMIGVRTLDRHGASDSPYLIYIHLGEHGDALGASGFSYAKKYGVRPVFLLSKNVRIKSGNGTSETPYELEI